MAKSKNNPVIVSLLLITLLTTLVYTPLIPFLGFYGDDFFFGYVAHFYDKSGLMQSLVVDRPFNGYLLIFLYHILGLRDNVFLWHIFMFFVRLSGGYALFFLLKKIWPKQLFVITSITLLFLIYPGFLQQTLPLGFGGWIITLSLWIFSLTLTVFAIKSNSKFTLMLFSTAALVLQINVFLQLEFFIGMEALRLLIITYILKNRLSFATVKKTFIYWCPYIISLLMFVSWRIFIFKSTREVTDINWVVKTFYSDPFWITKILLEVIYSFFQTVIFAYFLPILINFIRIPLENSIISILLGMGSAILFNFYYKKFHTAQQNTKKIGKQIFLIGLISVLISLIPIIISGRLVRVYLVYDRYTITSIIGVGLIITGFLLFKLSDSARRYFLVAIVAFSITSHLMNGFYRVDYWKKQQDLWWQLYWRAPNIQNNAMLILYFPPITENVPFKEIVNKVRWNRFYWVDYQIWAPGNLFFNYNDHPRTHFSGDFLEDKGIVDKIRNQVTESITDRNITYTKDFRNTVIITTPSDNSCLWVLDKEKGELPSHTNELLKTSTVYSDVDKLVKSESPIIPPTEIFGNEPPHGWCYYFQKASLARQLKNWDKLAQLKKEVTEKNLTPKDPNEWLPFEKGFR